MSSKFSRSFSRSFPPLIFKNTFIVLWTARPPGAGKIGLPNVCLGPRSMRRKRVGHEERRFHFPLGMQGRIALLKNAFLDFSHGITRQLVHHQNLFGSSMEESRFPERTHAVTRPSHPCPLFSLRLKLRHLRHF